MEQELKCWVCKRLFTNPILLPCSHSLCLACAVGVQTSVQQIPNPVSVTASGSSDQDSSATSTASSSGSNGAPTEWDFPEVDKLSLLSETDSGVVCNSRPNSYVGTPSVGNVIFHSIQENGMGINCPVCKRTIFMDEHGASGLPKNRALEAIVDKYGETKHIETHCQLCEGKTHPATSMCEQCEVFYCDTCRESCHPSRGPLAKHNLVPPTEGKVLLRAKHKTKESKCSEHEDEALSMYCMICKSAVCCVCVQDGRHINHDVQPLGAMCKAQKTELSQLLQAMSEKARAGTEFIQRLKHMADRVQDNCMEFEASVVAQCDSLIEALRARKQQLLQRIQEERDLKKRTFKEQVAHCTAQLQKTTGLLSFSIEALKEADPTAFLQISPSLLNRVSHMDQSFNKAMELEPRVSPDFELSLDNHTVLHAIQTLNFFQMKAPGRPKIIPKECLAENNSVTIAWQTFPGSVVDNYSLEIDDGNSGKYREVYRGAQTICTVDGLHFNSTYHARVKAFNHAGVSEYSECICLQTAEVAWFCMDPMTAHPDMIFSNNNLTVTCGNYDDRVVLGNVGFSKGVHYWEIHIDRYDNTPDPAFGVARFDVGKDIMLGKDDKGWAMYVDNKRSWFMHAGQHTDRAEGGIGRNAIIGVLLDLDQHTISYYINDEPHGPIAFTGLHGMFFPAMSLNRNVQVTIHSGLDPPPPADDSEDE